MSDADRPLPPHSPKGRPWHGEMRTSSVGRHTCKCYHCIRLRGSSRGACHSGGVGLPETDEHVDALRSVLGIAKKGRRWTVTLPLVDAVDEVRRWTDDHQQWHHANPKSWQSALRDLRRSLRAHGPEVLGHITDAQEALDEVDRVLALAGDKAIRSEPALRLRTLKVLDTIEQGLTTPGALGAAWVELRRNVEDPVRGPEAAERLLALARWVGHNPRRVCGLLDFRLSDTQEPPSQNLAVRRLNRVATFFADPPARSDIVVWLRALYASVGEPPVIEVGKDIKIYDAAWLRRALQGSVRHRQIPTECECGRPGRDRLRPFADRRFQPRPEPSLERDEYPSNDDIPVACIRVELFDVVVDQAPDIARRAAGALTCLGVIDGGLPNSWQLEETFEIFKDGDPWSGVSVAPPTAIGVVDHMKSVRDPTADVIRRHADELATELPYLKGRQRAAIDLLRWLRSAKSAPPAARLVLCDRAIETVAGWAGIATPGRFVEAYLIPSWAQGRVRNAFFAIAVDILFNDDRERYEEGDPRRLGWQEILDHPAIQLKRSPMTVNLVGLLSEWDWMIDRLPEDGPAWRRAQEIGDAATDGKSMYAWFTRLLQDAKHLEARRARTRNALMHGGPASDEVIQAVLPFAELMATEAVALSFFGSLGERSIPEVFLEDEAAIRRDLARLKSGMPPHRAFSGE